MVAYKTDPKETKKVHYVLSSVPGTTRGELKSREYAQPGDEFTSYQPYVFDLTTKTSKKVDVEATDFFFVIYRDERRLISIFFGY